MTFERYTKGEARQLTPRWTIVLSKSRAEWQVYRGLLWQGLHAYYPFTIDDARHGHWIQPVPKPLFPGYLFARSTGAVDLATIRKTIGVRDMLKSSGETVLLTEAQFRPMKARCEELIKAGEPSPDEPVIIDIGDLVTVPSGRPLEGLPAIVTGIDNHGNIEVSLGSFRTSFPRAELVASFAASERSRPSHGQTRNTQAKHKRAAA